VIATACPFPEIRVAIAARLTARPQSYCTSFTVKSE
jgi:hypothetical protein